jgi:hypothetical protein
MLAKQRVPKGINLLPRQRQPIVVLIPILMILLTIKLVHSKNDIKIIRNFMNFT